MEKSVGKETFTCRLHKSELDGKGSKRRVVGKTKCKLGHKSGVEDALVETKLEFYGLHVKCNVCAES